MALFRLGGGGEIFFRGGGIRVANGPLRAWRIGGVEVVRLDTPNRALKCAILTLKRLFCLWSIQ